MGTLNPPARGRRGALAACALGALVLAAAPVLAQAQDGVTRAAQLDAARDAKVTTASPPRRSSIERALFWYDNQNVLAKVFGGWHGFHPAGGDFPAGAGTKAGVGFTSGRWHGAGVEALAAASTNGYRRGSAALILRDLGRAPLDLRVHGQAYEYPQEDFFGLGGASREDDRSNYRLDGAEGGVDLRWRPAARLAVDAGVTYLSPTVGSGTDPRLPSTERVFNPATVPGLTAQPDFVRTSVDLAFEGRDNPRHPHAGGRYSLQLADYRDQDLDAFTFQRVAVNLQQYVPIPNRHRTLALRAAAVFTSPASGHDVPFYYQPTLGGSSTLRGFREFRFQDRNSVALSAEYRWEAWWALDGALFVDAGTVAPHRRDLALRDVDVTYGVGFRLHSNDAFISRLDLAFSREGFIPLLRFEHVF